MADDKLCRTSGRDFGDLLIFGPQYSVLESLLFQWFMSHTQISLLFGPGYSVRESLFPQWFIRYFGKPCSGSLGSQQPMEPHTLRPWGTMFPYWFYKGSLGETLVPRRGTQRPRLLQGDAISRPRLVFPMISKDSGKPCSGLRFAFFGPAGSTCFIRVLTRFGDLLFLAQVTADGP